MSDLPKPILFGQKEILNFINLNSEKAFQELLQNGFPARKIAGRWTAHVKNIEEYFQIHTKSTIK